MRGRRQIGGLAATVVTGAVALLVAQAAPAAPSSPLDHSGRWITDARGRTVILHGWNMVNKLPPYQPSALGFGADDARFLAKHGFNTVRLGLIWKGLEPAPGEHDREYVRQTRRTVDVLRREGIQVLLDFHQDMYNERFNGEGAPDWAVVGDAATLPPVPDQGFPANYLIMPALWRAYDHFLANDAGPGGVGLQDRYANAWRFVARRFRDVPEVMGYNLFNEPWPGTLWPTCVNPIGCPLSDALLTDFHRRVADRIRKADDEKLVWYAPYLLFDFGADTWHGDLGDDNAGFGFNMYCLAFAAGQLTGLTDLPSAAGCEIGYDLTLANAEAQSRETGDALLLTEFAATENVEVIQRVADAADEQMISWQQWAYFNEDPCCEQALEGLIRDPSLPPTGDNVKRDKLAVSSRPYPQVIAGTPESYGFAAQAKRFHLAYSTEGPGGRDFAGKRAETEVFLPRIHYRDGYEVRVEGGEIVSPRTADRLLRLRSCADAERVTVEVAPGSGRHDDDC